MAHRRAGALCCSLPAVLVDWRYASAVLSESFCDMYLVGVLQQDVHSRAVVLVMICPAESNACGDLKTDWHCSRAFQTSDQNYGTFLPATLG